MKKFSRTEVISLLIIFSILIVVSVPNFVISLRRARDQIRRDDMGLVQKALGEYYSDFKAFPTGSPDGRIMNCLRAGDKPVQGKDGMWKVDPIPCDWGKDPLKNLFSDKIYMPILPIDPDYQKGVTFLYLSDGNRYQLFAAMEGMEEAEIDPKIIARNLKCGSRVCNIGRSYDAPIEMSIEEYNKLLLNAHEKK